MVATYDPGQVLMVHGVIPISGFAEGDMISVQHQGDGVTAETGSAGETAFVESRDRRAIVSARLMATSPVNLALSAAYQAGNLPVPFLLQSLSTGEKHVAGEAKLRRIPDQTYNAQVPVREWEFVIAKLETVG